MVPRLSQVAVGVAGAGQTAVRAGLLHWRADLGGELERGCVMRAGLTGLTCLQENVPETVERVGLLSRITDLAERGQGLLKVPGSLLMAAELEVNLAQPEEGFGDADFFARFMEQGQGLPEVSFRVLI